MSLYERDDIFYCPGCGNFFDIATEKQVEVDLNTLSDRNFVASVMRDRKKAKRCTHLKKARPNKQASPKRGFGT